MIYCNIKRIYCAKINYAVIVSLQFCSGFPSLMTAFCFNTLLSNWIGFNEVAQC